MTIVIDPNLVPPSGITLDGVVDRIRSELIDVDNLNQLDDDIDATVESFLFRYPLTSVSRGSQVSVDDEVMHIWQASNDNREVRVYRGYNSQPSPHAAGTLCVIDGKNRKQLLDAINDELTSLWSKGLYQMRSVELDAFTYSNSTYAPSEIIGADVYDVEYLEISQQQEWRHLAGWHQSHIDNSVTLPPYLPSSRIRILYKLPYTRMTDGGDDVGSASGIHSEAIDILVWGALLRLTTTEELKRNQFRSQGDTRRPEEVPYRAVSLARNDIRVVRDERIIEEKDRLRKRFPMRRPGW